MFQIKKQDKTPEKELSRHRQSTWERVQRSDHKMIKELGRINAQNKNLTNRKYKKPPKWHEECNN